MNINDQKFIDFLEDQFLKAHPEVIKDEFETKFDNWLSDLSEEEKKKYWNAYVTETWKNHPDRSKPGITGDPNYPKSDGE